MKRDKVEEETLHKRSYLYPPFKQLCIKKKRIKSMDNILFFKTKKKGWMDFYEMDLCECASHKNCNIVFPQLFSGLPSNLFYNLQKKVLNKNAITFLTTKYCIYPSWNPPPPPRHCFFLGKSSLCCWQTLRTSRPLWSLVAQQRN